MIFARACKIQSIVMDFRLSSLEEDENFIGNSFDWTDRDTGTISCCGVAVSS